MKTIVVPTDLSPQSHASVEYAKRLLKEKDSVLVLHYALDKIRDDSGISVRNESDTTAKVTHLLDEMCTKLHLKKQAFKIEYDIRSGPVHQSTYDVVKEYKADLVIMHTHGADGLEAVFIPTNTARVIHNVQCPVLILPEKYRFETPELILWASDYKLKTSDKGLEYVREIALDFNSEIKIMHVQKSDDRPEFEEAVVSYDEGHYFTGEVPYSYKTVYEESITDGIVECLDEYPEIGLVVMVAREHSVLEKLFNSGNTDWMAFHTKKPLLVIHDN